MFNSFRVCCLHDRKTKHTYLIFTLALVKSESNNNKHEDHRLALQIITDSTQHVTTFRQIENNDDITDLELVLRFEKSKFNVEQIKFHKPKLAKRSIIEPIQFGFESNNCFQLENVIEQFGFISFEPLIINVVCVVQFKSITGKCICITSDLLTI